MVSGLQYFWNCRKVVFSRLEGTWCAVCASIALEQLQLDIDDVALRLVRLATERGVTLCCAESLTAGMVSSNIASVPGASAVLLGGAVTYTNQIKRAPAFGFRKDDSRGHRGFF